MNQEEMKSPKQQPNKQSGFTLVEVMVTMVIIGLLTAVVVVNVLPAQDKGSIVKARVDISTLEQALGLYRLEMQTYPESLEDLVRLPAGTNDPRFPVDGFIKRLPDDPWGRPYLYAYPGEYGSYDIWSLGADGQEGGEGVNADINSWDR
jgi:general secretion pathway protein G